MSHPASLQRQLIGWLLLPFLAIWLTGGFMSYMIAVRFADLAHDRGLFDSALTLASQVRSENGAILLSDPETALKMIAIDPYDKIYFRISGPDHKTVAGQPELPAPQADDILPEMPYYSDGFMEGRHVRIASIYHTIHSGKQGALVLVQVAETLKKRRVMASEILASVAVPQLLLISLALALGWFGIRRGLASLERIQKEVRNRSHLDLSPLQEENAPREVGALVHALNELLHQLQTAISAQTRFIANAAHQLRTPLAGIKTQAEFALRQSDPELIRHSLQQLHASNDRTIHLVNQLLALARAEPGWEAPVTTLDLVAVASKTTSEWVPAALKKNIDLGFEAGLAAALFPANEMLLREMLNNLIDNAIRYTQPDGEITVRISQSDHLLTLAVEDNGPGIPPPEHERVFERFHRAASPEENGCGLGLAIVREIAHLHHGEVYLVDTPKGALFEVRLPL
ncbi:MAG TPA: sensor histidine kinase [Gallionellaceae bacterium]